MSDTVKKLMMLPFVSYERRSYLYALLAARLELEEDVDSTQHCFWKSLNSVRKGLEIAQDSDNARGGIPTSSLVGTEQDSVIDMFKHTFGTLTASEQVMLQAISEQKKIASVVKALRSLAALVGSEIP